MTFTDQQLQKISNQGLIYMCACPAQVAETIKTIRALIQYQRDCLEKKPDDQVHIVIEDYAKTACRLMEMCMEEILYLEKWDKETLEMPAGLRQLQLKSIEDTL